MAENNETKLVWCVVITLSAKGRSNTTHVEVLRCGKNLTVATLLLEQLQRGVVVVSSV
jgi:hypothetical protein